MAEKECVKILIKIDTDLNKKMKRVVVILFISVLLLILSLNSCTRFIENQINKIELKKIQAALEENNMDNRNFALSIITDYSGEFSIHQVCEIYSFVTENWHYFSDPYGSNFYFPVSNTINNNFKGDCDDFAIFISSMIHSVGGRVRIIIASTDETSHAFTEVFLNESPDKVLEEINYHYQNLFQYLFGISAVNEINYVEDYKSGIWLNIDWNSKYPGGEYFKSEKEVVFYPYEDYFIIAN